MWLDIKTEILFDIFCQKLCFKKIRLDQWIVQFYFIYLLVKSNVRYENMSKPSQDIIILIAESQKGVRKWVNALLALKCRLKT